VEALEITVSLEDKISGTAKLGAEAVEKLSKAFGEAKEKLSFYQGQLSKANTIGDIAGHKQYAELVTKTTQEVLNLGHALDAVGGPIKKHGDDIKKVVEPIEIARHAIEGISTGLGNFGKGIASGEAKEAIAGITEAAAGLASSLDLVYPGLGQVASAAIKVGGAFVEMSAGLVETALEVTALNEKLEATFEALGTLGEDSGKKTIDFLNTLSTQLPQSRGQLAEWTKSFEALGDTDLDRLRYEVTATASAQAIMGDKGAQTYQNLSKKIHEAVEAGHGLKLSEKSLTQLYNAGVNVNDVASKMGVSVKALAAGLKAGTTDAEKFGNALSDTLIAKGQRPLEAMTTELSTLYAKAQETWNHFFDGIDTKPLTDVLQQVIWLGDQGQPSGQALKVGITTGLNAIIKEFAHVIHSAEVFFLKMEVMALQTEVALKPMIGFLKQIGILQDENAAKAPPLLQPPDFSSWSASIKTVWNQFLYGPDLLDGGIEDLFVKNGQNASKGLADGLRSGIPEVHKAGAEAGTAAVDGAKKALDAHSPSRVAMSLGFNVGTGLAIGVRDSADLPRREAAKVGAYTAQSIAIGSGQAASQAPQGGPSRSSITIGNITVTAPNGVTDAEKLSIIGLATAFERMQLMEAR
jgi:hypothetical protein